MKLGVSQSTVQSDATNIIPCLGLLSYVTVAASSRAPTRSPPTSSGARDVARHGRARVVGGRTGSGVEAPAEFIVDELSDEFSRHALGKGAWAVGRGVAVAGLRWRWRLGGAGCVCAALRAVLRRGGRCPCCAGRRFGVLPVVVQDRGYGPDSAARGVPSLQFLDKVVTCPLLRRQVHGGAVLGHGC